MLLASFIGRAGRAQEEITDKKQRTEQNMNELVSRAVMQKVDYDCMMPYIEIVTAMGRGMVSNAVCMNGLYDTRFILNSLMRQLI